MMSEYIKTVTESDFEYEVLAYSQNTPVLVGFWPIGASPVNSFLPSLKRSPMNRKALLDWPKWTRTATPTWF